MPNISDRGNLMPASPIRKLVPFADAARARGTEVYHLNIGQPDIETPKVFWEAIKAADIKTLEYSHSAGIQSYREKLVSYYGNCNIDLKLEDVMVTTGGSEAIRFVFMSCFNAGDEIIIPEPAYANYFGFAIESGLKAVPITTRIEDDFDLPDIAEFEKLITPKTKGIMICNPGNPTGKLYSKESLLKLKELISKYDLYLISDEVYREFAYDGFEHFSALNLRGIEQNVIMVDSISKRFSACGARIGTMVSRNQAVMKTALKFAQARLSPPTLGQVGAEAMFDLPQSYYDEVNTEYANRRDTLVQALKKIEGIQIPNVSGAFYMIVGLPVENAEAFCQWMLEHFSYEGATVMMAPAAGFYATPGLGTNQVRIAYVLAEEHLKKAMTCLAEGLKAYPGSKMEPQQLSAAN